MSSHDTQPPTNVSASGTCSAFTPEEFKKLWLDTGVPIPTGVDASPELVDFLKTLPRDEAGLRIALETIGLND